MVQPRLIIICGPTCVEKTRVGIELAKKFNGEIVSADSQQVYKGLDIGTAKPTKENRKLIPHHLIDIVDPNKIFDAATFMEMADAAIINISSRGKQPFVVGGTGLYIKALCYGLSKAPGRDEAYRSSLMSLQKKYGTPHLYKMLQDRDADAATSLKQNDTTRIVRALEVLHITGRSIREFHNSHGFGQPKYATLKIGLNIDRKLLYERIDERVDKMVAAGLIEEANELIQKYGADCQALKAVGYKEIVQSLPSGKRSKVVQEEVVQEESGKRSKVVQEEIVQLIKRNTRRYAKRQLTWFKKDKEIEWYNPAELDKIIDRANKFLVV